MNSNRTIITHTNTHILNPVYPVNEVQNYQFRLAKDYNILLKIYNQLTLLAFEHVPLYCRLYNSLAYICLIFIFKE